MTADGKNVKRVVGGQMIDDIDKQYDEWVHMCKSCRDHWLEMLRDYCGSNKFIREFASKRGRILVRDVQELLNYIIHYGYDLRTDIYVSVNSFRVIDEDKGLPDYLSYNPIRRIVFDIDSEGNLNDARSTAFELADTIEDMSVGFSRVLWTGGRGFHVYFTPDEFILSNKTQVELCRNVWVELGEPDIVDTKLFGDVARDIRVPYTLHPRTGLQMIPVQDDMSMGVIMERSEDINIPEPVFGDTDD